MNKRRASSLNQNNEKIASIDIDLVKSLLEKIFSGRDKTQRLKFINRLLQEVEWIILYVNKSTSRKVMAEFSIPEHFHELETVMKLTEADYDVIFAPKGLFIRHQKKFDVFLIKNGNLMKAELKTVYGKNPKKIAKIIKDGCDQASRVILDIRSNIETKDLVEAIRSGTYRNEILSQLMIIYKRRFYLLPKNLILSNTIYNVLA